MNATNHLDNAWARLERNELDFDAFCDAFEAEAAAAGGRVDARDLFAAVLGAAASRAWSRPCAAATSTSRPGC